MALSDSDPSNFLEPTQIRLMDLLRQDELYRRWFSQIPLITVVGSTDPWRLFIQREQGGRWAKADFPSYPKAYHALKLKLPECHDATIHSRRQFFPPPVVKVKGHRHRNPMPEGHHWCSLCRRPTVFRTFYKHPNLPTKGNSQWIRCSICGMRAVAMKAYSSPLVWPLKLTAGRE